MHDVLVRLKADTTPAKTINAETAEIAEQPQHLFVGSWSYVGSGLSRIAALTLTLLALATPTHAQTPVVVERVTFQQAIDRAIANNPSTAVAAAGILRAEGL